LGNVKARNKNHKNYRSRKKKRIPKSVEAQREGLVSQALEVWHGIDRLTQSKRGQMERGKKEKKEKKEHYLKDQKGWSNSLMGIESKETGELLGESQF